VVMTSATVAHTNGGNSISRKDRWTLAISILALLMSVAAFWESHRSIELEVAKARRTVALVSPLLSSVNDLKDPTAYFLVIPFINTGEVPLSIKETVVHFAVPNSTTQCSVDLGHLADAHDTPEKPQLVEAGDSGDSSLAVHFPASCTSPGMKVLVGITFNTIDSLGAKKQIRKAIWLAAQKW
jgi:hypothetical protein